MFPNQWIKLGLMIVCVLAWLVVLTGLAWGQWEVDLVIYEVEDERPFLDYPVAVVTDDVTGLLYVSDWGNNRLVVFDRDGNTRRVLGDLNGPVGLALDRARNRLYLVEMQANRVRILDLETLATLGYLEAQNPSFQEPRGIVVDEAGQVYVVDTNRSRVVAFDQDDREIMSFGREGMGNDEFYLPRGIAIDRNGRIWIADTVHHAVKVVDRGGNFLFRFGQRGSGDADFDRVRYVSIRDEFVFLTDYNNHRLKVYDLEGNLVEIVGSRGAGLGQFVSPEGIWSDTLGRVWVADAGNSRIKRMNFGYLIDRRSHLNVLLEEGRIEELLSLVDDLPEDKRNDPEIGRLLYEAYQRKGNTEQMLLQAEILWVSDEENRAHWRSELARLYYQKASTGRGIKPLDEIRDLFQQAYRFGYRRAYFAYLWTTFLLMGGSSLTLIFLAIFLFILLIVFYRIKTSRYRRW